MVGQSKAVTEKEARKDCKAIVSEFLGPVTTFGRILPEKAQSGLKGGQRFVGQPGTSTASKVIQVQPIISCSESSNRQGRQLSSVLEVCLKHTVLVLQDARLPGFLHLQAKAAEESLSRAFKWLFQYPRCSFYGSSGLFCFKRMII